MSNLQNDPAIRSLLERMPKSIQTTFTDEQLAHLKIAIGARQWGNHAVDCRGVVKLFKYRYYYVFLAGRNRRELSVKEQKIARFTQAIILSLAVTFTILLTLLVLYLIKSALGIDIFEGYSFGVWSWFKGLFN
ncbi:3-phosphoshikimate 1-carboxyvinyltransferase [Pseudoalteromonas sp. Scap03]|uniref:3-phosphoshikimate 1-carboxyvinyltransferase n=1 Tax=unclassified Pseudoalteromonas TaxID=194690 RepID=UPI0015BC403F|nr:MULTISPECIES: 3-phosphoshikimate 1-carboxyvinyltransferase [unclassified Pseudoalteromonas]NWL16067.1 3-phosphoshikimate 1-carboxyvinyltransferase [Pseudoalteromonas sp. Scap03]QLE81200.1 3-phosphoshikimate 1-carboxyvinyltransferase [Pseudoalteromonas sp. Scap25]QLE89143.1 3-phosphoshikimate 1-carboxyvinyltransferase [Pseudoalteromonas sp. Scap06]